MNQDLEAKRLPRMRTAQGVLAEIKSEDPGSGITLHYIRRIIASKQVTVVPVGRKKLVSVDAVINFLESGQPITSEVTTGYIRRVEG